MRDNDNVVVLSCYLQHATVVTLQDKGHHILIDHGCGCDFDSMNSLALATPAWSKPRAESVLADSKGVHAAKKAALAIRATSSSQISTQGRGAINLAHMSSTRDAQLLAALRSESAGQLASARKVAGNQSEGSSFKKEGENSYRTLGFRHPIEYTVKLRPRELANTK
jgi:hypothetical protein